MTTPQIIWLRLSQWPIADEAKFIEPNGLKFFIVEVHQSRDLIAISEAF